MSDQLQPLGIKYIQEKLHESYGITEMAENRSLVLLLGTTGVGKSTTCNYLLGHEMQEVETKDEVPVIVTVREPTVRIGHKVDSETLFAVPILLENFPWVLTDCPGFLDTRSIEDRIIASISVELTVRKAKEIKSILILISFNSLQDTRAIELRSLVKTLKFLFKDPIEMVQYCIFVITKKSCYVPDGKARQETIGRIKTLRNHCETNAEKLKDNPIAKSIDGLSCIDYDAIATFLSAVLDKQDEIIFINPLDNGVSRGLIIDKINNIKPRKNVMKKLWEGAMAFAVGHSANELKPITINDFNFSMYDENRTKFNTAIYDLADKGHEIIKNLRQCNQIIQHADSAVCDFKTRLQIDSWREMVLQNKKECEKQMERIQEIDAECQKLNEELSKINTSSPLVFRKESINKEISRWKPFGWELMKFDANTGDENVPIVQVDKTMENGTWVKEEDCRGNGIYKTTYYSNYGARPAKASVVAYIETKDDPGNKIRIQQIQKQFQQLATDLEQNNKEVKKLQSENESLNNKIEEAKTDNLSEEARRKAEQEQFKQDTDIYKSSIANNEKIIQDRKIQCSELLSKFNEMRPMLDIVVKITEKLDFPSPLVKQFVDDYKKFLVDLDGIIQIFVLTLVSYLQLSH